MDKTNGNLIPQPRWYFTIGAHGGEFAIKADSKGFASKELRKAVKAAFDDGGNMAGRVMVREAPRQLDIWLNDWQADMGPELIQLNPNIHMRVFNGGYLLNAAAPNCYAMTFVQIPGAGNITILSQAEEKPSEEPDA